MNYSPAARAIGAVLVGVATTIVAQYAGMSFLLSSAVFILVVVGLYLLGGLSLTKWSEHD
jgi:sensor histidine kinase regulating citrate/malate metabolism